MDNRVFNVNGTDNYDNLLEVLKLGFKHGNFGLNRTVKGWSIDKEHGFVLHDFIPSFSNEGVNKFPLPLNVESIYPIIQQYLDDKDTWNNTEFDKWDEDLDHDGHNTKGWRVYCEDWGHIGHNSGAFLTIKPAYMWMGK